MIEFISYCCFDSERSGAMLVFWTVLLAVTAVASWGYWIYWSEKWWVPNAWKVTFVIGVLFALGLFGKEWEPKWGPLWCLTVGLTLILISAVMTISFEAYRRHMYNKTFLLPKPRENRALYIQLPR